MSFQELHKGFRFKIIESNKRDKFGDRVYSYKVMSKKSENEVKKYCMTKLKPCYEKKDMPNLFSPELLEFRNITNLNNEMGEMYFFKVKLHSTA
jgi:hypothetical protein